MSTGFFANIKDKLTTTRFKAEPLHESRQLQTAEPKTVNPPQNTQPADTSAEEKQNQAKTITADDIIKRHKETKLNSTKKYHFFRRARQEYWTDKLGKLEGEMPRDLRRYWESYSIEEQGQHRLAAKEARGWFVVTCLAISLVFYRLSEYGDWWLYLSFPFMLASYCFVIALVFKAVKSLWIFLFHRKKVPVPESDSYFERGIFTVVTEYVAIGIFKIPREDIEKFIAYSKEDRKFKEIFDTTLNKEASAEIRSFLLNFIFITVFFWLSQRISVALNNNVSRVGLLIAPIKMVVSSIQKLFV